MKEQLIEHVASINIETQIIDQHKDEVMDKINRQKRYGQLIYLAKLGHGWE